MEKNKQLVWTGYEEIYVSLTVCIAHLEIILLCRSGENDDPIIDEIIPPPRYM